MSKYGCPDPDINDWKYGYVNVSFRNDVEFEGVDNLMGPFSRRNLQLTFCTMTPDDADWVRGVTADWLKETSVYLQGKVAVQMVSVIFSAVNEFIHKISFLLLNSLYSKHYERS